jgi:hypothetical protein
MALLDARRRCRRAVQAVPVDVAVLPAQPGRHLSWALPVLLRQGELAEARQERFWSDRPRRQPR